MRIVYEAANTLEAHMLIDVLRQQGLQAQLQGEHLTGAAGELPAVGLVRLAVDEADWSQARAALARWEAEHPAEPARPPAPGRGRFWRGLALGLGLGVAATWAVFHLPGSVEGIDRDRDGLLDETWTYAVSGRPLRVESDRNLDHRVDLIAGYDDQGELASAEADEDFDGRFETHRRYRDGQLASSEADTDGDGFPDLRVDLVDGVVRTMTLLNPATGLALRVERLHLGRAIEADVDTDRDGRLDTRFEYGVAGEISGRRPLP
jgi:hypothetical protein